MQFENDSFASIGLEGLHKLDAFFTRTAFVISHTHESLETLLGVLWYLPTQSSILILTNCPVGGLGALVHGLRERMPDRRGLYIVHQKDASIAAYFRDRGVLHLLGEDGRVNSGKGEGMYMGALCAALLGSSWVIFFDADNFVPCSLIEYTIAMGRMFLAAGEWRARDDAAILPALHTVRISRAAKPTMDESHVQSRLPDRCNRVVSPLINTLLRQLGYTSVPIITSNAGEQGMTLQTAKTLRFSSGFSAETMLFLDLFVHGMEKENGRVLFQQYCAHSPHFHHTGDEDHTRLEIAQSLGCFEVFADLLPHRIVEELGWLCDDLGMRPERPLVYPSLESLDVVEDPALLGRFRLADAPEIVEAVQA